MIYGELRVDALPAPTPVAVVALPRFPGTSRDVSIDLALEIPAADVVDALTRAAGPGPGDDPVVLAPPDHGGAAVEVVEDYRGQGVEPGRRALLLRLGYRAHGRTVSDAEVQERHDAVVQAALAELRARDPAAHPR
ncbi:MAG: hypothetical protein KDK70_21470 [Myxococcales bacterium]|nr:hypothetical protein [Myxococcales bacterium]